MLTNLNTDQMGFIYNEKETCPSSVYLFIVKAAFCL